MSIVRRKARPIRVTGTGEAIGRSTGLFGFSIIPAAADLAIEFRNIDGDEILWQAEADSASGSHAEMFSVPIRFAGGIKVVFSQDDPNQAVYLLVDEPEEVT